MIKSCKLKQEKQQFSDDSEWYIFIWFLLRYRKKPTVESGKFPLIEVCALGGSFSRLPVSKKKTKSKRNQQKNFKSWNKKKVGCNIQRFNYPESFQESEASRIITFKFSAEIFGCETKRGRGTRINSQVRIESSGKPCWGGNIAGISRQSKNQKERARGRVF